jgi:hypothetical protein
MPGMLRRKVDGIRLGGTATYASDCESDGFIREEFMHIQQPTPPEIPVVPQPQPEIEPAHTPQPEIPPPATDPVTPPGPVEPEIVPEHSPPEMPPPAPEHA